MKGIAGAKLIPISSNSGRKGALGAAVAKNSGEFYALEVLGSHAYHTLAWIWLPSPALYCPGELNMHRCYPTSASLPLYTEPRWLRVFHIS